MPVVQEEGGKEIFEKWGSDALSGRIKKLEKKGEIVSDLALFGGKGGGGIITRIIKKCALEVEIPVF
jgi:hypothetical protein